MSWKINAIGSKPNLKRKVHENHQIPSPLRIAISQIIDALPSDKDERIVVQATGLYNGGRNGIKSLLVQIEVPPTSLPAESLAGPILEVPEPRGGLVAKFRANSVEKDEYGEAVSLQPVYSDDPANPNHAWSEATPCGQLQMFISNPDAHGVIAEGKEYLVRISEAPAETTSETENPELPQIH